MMVGLNRDHNTMEDPKTIPLTRLLDLADLGPVTWISGEAQAHSCQVAWVTTDPASVEKGDLLLVEGRLPDASRLEAWHEKGAAAVLMLGLEGTDLPELEAGLPLVGVAPRESLRHTARRLVTVLVDHRAHLMEWGSGVHAQLAQLEAEGAGLRGLAQAIMEISGQSVVVQDKRMNVVAASPSPPLAAVWEPLLEQLGRVESLPEGLRDRKQAGREPVVIHQDLPGGLTRLVMPVTVGGVARGYLSLIAPTGELDAMDHLVVEKGALVFALELARSKAVREAEKRLHGDLLDALLQGDLEARDSRLWAQSMGLDLAQAHVAMRFAWGAASPPSRRRLETLVNGEVAHQGLAVIVNPMESEVICFCQIAPQTAPPRVALDFGQAVIDHAREENPAAVVYCGVGAPADTLTDWRVSFRQAGQALQMARRLDAAQPLYFHDLSVYRLLLQLEGHPELRAFLEETLGPVLAYETGEELLRTLKAYFEHNANLSQTAESLFIHRNTLVYRLERIAEITNLDLDNPETRLAVQLALHIHQMLGPPGR